MPQTILSLNGLEPVEAPYAIELRGVHKSYGLVKVLSGIDIRVPRGTVTALIGPSGSGKSTCLRCVNLLEYIDEGEIFVDGCPVISARSLDRQWPWWERRAYSLLYGSAALPKFDRTLFVRESDHRRRVGMVFQEYNLWPRRTVLGNLVEGPIHVNGENRVMCVDRAVVTLEMVGLTDVLSRYPHELSGGQRQRVAIARSLMMGCRILLLDEITSALDPELVHEVLGVVRRLAESDVSMLLVTHHIEFARGVADNVVMLEKGRVIENGPAREVLSNPQAKRTQVFISSLNHAR